MTASEELAPESRPRRLSPAARPWIAALANLLAAPMGHVVAGAALRGVVVCIALFLASVAIVWSVPLVPGWVTVAMLVSVVPLSLAALLGDAWRQASRHAATPRRYQRWYAYLGILLLVLVAGEFGRGILRTRVQPFRIAAGSMLPTLLVGDYVFVDRAAYGRARPRPGDLVAFEFPLDRSKLFIKRVIAVPPQTIEIRDKQVYIDGAPLAEPYLHFTDRSTRPAGIDPRDNFGPYTIGADQYFLMGDHRDNSNDSRYYGPVSADLLAGRVATIYFSNDPEGGGIRWNRIGEVPR